MNGETSFCIGSRLAEWIIERWDAEVKNRPLTNIHRRTLDDTWRQMYRKVTAGEELPRPKKMKPKVESANVEMETGWEKGNRIRTKTINGARAVCKVAPLIGTNYCSFEITGGGATVDSKAYQQADEAVIDCENLLRALGVEK